MEDIKTQLPEPRISSPTTQEDQSDSIFRPFAPTVSVVIPTLNEAKNLPDVLQKIPRWIDEVVLVDGCSTDGTLDIARNLWPNNHIVTLERRTRVFSQQLEVSDRRKRGIALRLVTQKGRGKGSALREGVESATGDIIVMMDADGSNDPSEIPAFLGLLFAGADFVKGSRFLQGGGTLDMPLYRRLGNSSFVLLVRLLFGGTFSDLCYGYNAFWAKVAPRLAMSANGFEIETLMNIRALRLGLRVAEIPSFEYKRKYGESRLRTFPDGLRVLVTILREAAQHYNRHSVPVMDASERAYSLWS